MAYTNDVIPKQVRVFAFLLTLIGIGAGIAGYLKPELVVPGFISSTAAHQTMAMMFAGRNLAMGIMMLFVGIAGIPETFLLIFMIRFLTELQDIIAMITNAATLSAVLPVVIFIAIIMVLEVWVVIAMFGIIRKRNGMPMSRQNP